MMGFKTVGEQVERWVEKFCLPCKERRKQMVEQAFEARGKDSSFCETAADVGFDSAIARASKNAGANLFSKRFPNSLLKTIFGKLKMGGGDGLDAEGDEDDSDTEEEEAIGKQEVAPPVSNQVEATT
ncbi:hypothetical protein Tco_1560847 [Tanacetum coccineum]